MDADTCALLQRTTNVLLEAAKYYVVSNGKTAVKAREAASATASKLSGGSDPFHAALHGRLTSLQGSLKDIETIASQAEDAVSRLLNSFEHLIEGSDNDAQTRYPGLQRLQDLFEADKVTKRRPKPLGYRKYLFNPGQDIKVRLKQDIADCCDALSNNDVDQDSAAILSDLETIQEWKVPASMLRHASRIRSVLYKYWTCQCHHGHENVKLAFTALPSAYPSDDIVGCYQLCWPLSNGSTISHTWPALHLLEQQQSSPKPKSNPGKKSVRFASSHLPDTEVSVSRTTTLSTICEALGTSNGQYTVQLNEDVLRTVISDHTSGQPNISTSSVQSLRSALGSAAVVPFHKTRPKDRIVIAMALAYTYLHLSDTEWWPKREVQPDFWFKNDLSRSALQVTLPFLHFQPTDTTNAKVSTEGYINPKRPSLPAFGKLLLEIWKGSKINWGEELDSVVAECELDPLGEYWLCAVNACLGTENVLKEDGSFSTSVRMRAAFVLKVIKSLQWLFEKCVRQPVDTLFAAPEEAAGLGKLKGLGALSLKRDAASYTAALDPPKDANLWCLHDGSRNWEQIADKGDAAGTWFNVLRRDVHSSLGQHSDLVRVAIIDTGAVFDKKTMMIYGSRVKEVRSWVGLHGNKDGLWRPDGEDTDGHGTHATSVFLEVDPYSEVYVAKVFDSRDEKQGIAMQTKVQTRIANAILYAVGTWKVQVISLSFGFEQQVDIIKRAIVAAEDSNVIVLAAASNCGGNARLSWPARHPTVLSIYATDGLGNKYHRNPTQQKHDDNFATLGSDVKAWWPSGQKVLRSGTSTATPIAAAMGSMTIHFMRQYRSEYLRHHNVTDEDFDELVKRMSTYSGMRSIFRLMVDRDVADRDGYSYLAPRLIFDKSLSRMTVVDKIVAEMKQC